jgi:hypothetical protein
VWVITSFTRRCRAVMISPASTSDCRQQIAFTDQANQLLFVVDHRELRKSCLTHFHDCNPDLEWIKVTRGRSPQIR